MLDTAFMILGAVASFFTGGTNPVIPPAPTQQAAISAASTTSTSPLLKIDTLKSSVNRGESLDVSWTSANIPTTARVNISLAAFSGNTPAPRPLANSILVSAKSKAIVIPATVPEGTYKITLAPVGVTLGSDSVLSSSELVVTSAAIPNAELSVFAPKSGTSFIKGSTLDVSWDFLVIPSTTPVVLSFVQSESNQETPIVATGATLGPKTRRITVPTTLAAGSYKIKVVANPVGKASVVSYTPVFTIADSVDLKSTCPAVVFNRDIVLGDVGNDVAALHNFMKTNKYITTAPTGKYDTTLQAAVQKYQNAKGIYPANGVVGATTREMLNSECSGSGSTATAPALDVTIEGSKEIAQGSSLKVSWTSKNLPLSNALTFKLLNTATNKETVMTPATLAGTKTSFTATPGTAEIYIPSTVAAGEYSIMIETVLANKTKVSTREAFTVVQSSTESGVSYRDADCRKVTFSSENLPSRTEPSYEAAALSNFLASKKGAYTKFTNVYDDYLNMSLIDYVQKRKIENSYDYSKNTFFSSSTAAYVNADCRASQEGKAFVRMDDSSGTLTAGKETTFSWVYIGSDKVSTNETATLLLMETYGNQKLELAKNVRIADGKVKVTIPTKVGWYNPSVRISLVPKNLKMFSNSSEFDRYYNFVGAAGGSVVNDFTTNIATGTTYTAGDVLTVTWKTSQINAGENIKISVIEDGASYIAPQYAPATVALSKGSHTIVLPKTMPAKTYRVNVTYIKTDQYNNVPISPAFQFNPNLNALTPAKIVMNKNMPTILHYGKVEGRDEASSVHIANVAWTTTGNIGPTDKMEIHLVPKGATVSGDKYKIWEGLVNEKKLQYLEIPEFVGTPRTQIVPGKYNLVFKPLVARLDQTSVLVSNDIEIRKGGIQSVSVDKTAVRPGDKLKVTWTTAATPAGMQTRVWPTFGDKNGEIVLVGRTSVSTTTSSYVLTIPANASIGKAKVQVDQYYQPDIVCGVVCVTKNPTLHLYFTSSASADFEVVR